MSACTCNRNGDGEVTWYADDCPEHYGSPEAAACARADAEYAKGEREWNWDIPRGGL